MDRNYINMILQSGNLTAMQYKIIFTLMLNEYTKAQLAEELGVSQQSINPVANNLLELGLIKISRIEGRNQYLACNSSLVATDIKKFKRELEEAEELYDEYSTLSYAEIDELDNDEFIKYRDALYLLCKQKLYTESTLTRFDEYFSHFLNCCLDDGISCDLERVERFLEGNITSWSYPITHDCAIDIEYTFVNKNITLDYIQELEENDSDIYSRNSWEEIVNENVKITKIELV